jgi:hypothetical protein
VVFHLIGGIQITSIDSGNQMQKNTTAEEFGRRIEDTSKCERYG